MSKKTGPNRRVQNNGLKNWVKLTDVKRWIQIGGPNQNGNVTET